jgi:hypothetical protein
MMSRCHRVQYLGGAEVGAKNEALFSGRVPHVRPSVHGPKTDFSNAFTSLDGILPLAAVSGPPDRSAGRGCARLFRPMYAGANMGHPSRTIGSCYEMKSAGFCLNLIWTSLKFSRPFGTGSSKSLWSDYNL